MNLVEIEDRSALGSIHFEIGNYSEKFLKFEHLINTIDRIWLHFEIYWVTDDVKVEFLGQNIANICNEIERFCHKIQS